MLVAALVPTAILEGVLRDVVAWRSLAIVLGVALALVFLWRRSHPFAVFLAAFGTTAAVDVSAWLVGVEYTGLYSGVFLLLLVYSLFRWGAGREALVGLLVMLVVYALSLLRGEITEVGDGLGGAVVFLFPAALGASVRFRARAQQREVEQAKLLERGQLARELHDTVAHHVSAIAIQAQAGRAVASKRPEAAVRALEVIEQEASRTLAELRVLVGALRDDEDAALAPQPGVRDIARLAESAGRERSVELELTGDIDDLPSSLQAALYRLAQESLTNAMRHAKHPTHIAVRLDADDDVVRLTVTDDGELRAKDARSSSGFGLVGMEERAALLGGTFRAGPDGAKGWRVEAVLPRSGGVR